MRGIFNFKCLVSPVPLQARRVLTALRGGAQVDTEMDSIRAALQEEQSVSALDLCRNNNDNMRYRMLVGLGLVFLQQV